MLSTALTILALGGGTAQRLPDQLDVLRGADRTPQVRLLIDLSGSMLDVPPDPTSCTWYLANRGSALQNYSGGGNLSRIDQLLAVLTGCQSSDDGIIDRWASQMVFGVDGFLGNNSVSASPMNLPEIVPFPTSSGVAYSSNRSAVETALLNNTTVNWASGTPLVPGYHQSALHFRDFTDSNTEQCRPNAIVLMTDGVGNSGEFRIFDQVSGVPPTGEIRDDAGCFQPGVFGEDRSADGYVDLSTLPPATCSSNYQPDHADVAAAYLWGDLAPTGARHDALPNVTGTQPIRTYTIGFSVTSSRSERLLQDMADAGGGAYLSASNYNELYDSFDRIMTSIRANAETSFRGITVQGEGLFSGNWVYQNSFQGVEDGHWFGNIKKFCLFPSTETDDNCVFRWDPGIEDLVLNPAPVDDWSGRQGRATQEGGAGLSIWQQMRSGTTSFDDPLPANPYANRHIITWDPVAGDYIDVSPSNTTFGPSDTFTLNACQHYALLNYLYGYTFSTAGCTAGSAAPTGRNFWPLADTINGGQALLRYGESCEGPSADCYLVTVSNAGMLHIFNTDTGRETQAIIPPQFFGNNTVAHNQLSEVNQQPSLDFTRRYYFDGGISVYHDDLDSDGQIDASEPAYLIAGFGRGGAAYIKWDISELPNGRVDRSRNPPHPLTVDQATGFQHLRDTWAAPWVGNHQLADGRVRPVAVFPTGHQAELDDPDALFGALTPNAAPASGDTESSPYGASCADLGIPPEVCSTPSVRDICNQLSGVPPGLCGTLNRCSPCESPDVNVCANQGHTPPYCYDWPGLAAFDPAPLAPYGIVSLSPLRVSVGPYSYSETVPAGTGGCAETVVTGQAYRINFSRMSLQPGDSVIIYDGGGREVERFTGNYPSGVQTGWIRSSEFRLRLVTDGDNDAEAYGYTISGIDVVRDRSTNPTCSQNRPGIYVVDLEEWNGESAGFADIPGPSETRQASGLVARFTSDCAGSTVGPDETCVDQSYTGAGDLQYMTCPISAEPAVYTEGGILRGIYFGDECGQVWSITRSSDASSWEARRLLSTNDTGAGGSVISGYASRHYRKIFAPVELVVSTCTGRRGIGVYFGTGNLQRPAAIPSTPLLPTDPDRNLEGPAVTDVSGTVLSHQADLMGVVWDTPDVPSGGYELSDLTNVTLVEEIDPTAGTAQAGFFQELARDEKILRSPVVFDGVAFFTSYQPTVPATECEDAVGRNVVYGFDNCTAAPVRAAPNLPGGRVNRQLRTNDDSFIGSGLSVVTGAPGSDIGPGGNGAMVIGGEGAAGDAADLQSMMDEESNGGVRLLMWRIDVD